MNIIMGKSNEQSKNSPIMELLKHQKGSASDAKPVNGEEDTSSPQPVGDDNPPPAAETPKASKQQVLGPDRLMDSAHAIENLKDEATAVTKIHELIDEQGFNYFQLGGVFQVMHEKKWYAGHKTFGEMCEEEFGTSLRKAQYFVKIYNFVVNSELTWEQIKTVGWTKMRVIAQRIETKEALPWIEKAKTMSVQKLRQEVKKLAETGEQKAITDVSTKTFKLHADQKEVLEAALDKAKTEGPTEYDSVALENVCLDFLSAGASKPKELPDEGPGKSVAVKGAVISATPGQPEYVWPEMRQHFERVKAEYGDDLDGAISMVFEAFELVFPEVEVQIRVP